MLMDSVEGVSKSSYYDILGVPIDSTAQDIRHAYRKLAMKWHPDKWANNPSQMGKAKLKFQQIQEAYSVLSDQRKRRMYDAGFYDPDNDDDEDEGFADFLQELSSLVHQTRNEGKHYGVNELQSMFWDMAQSFGFSECPTSPRQQENWCSSPQQPACDPAPQLFCGQFPLDDSRCSKRARIVTDLYV